ncbi:hypothetical protein [Enhygromyxa salina]|uniref:hypothetical protein n=1 Tax=Enhygromyxa salina TaxID=215803 RepID=UPI000D037AA3|nr:hypothetical protein [Enhygromyxa salina]
MRWRRRDRHAYSPSDVHEGDGDDDLEHASSFHAARVREHERRAGLDKPGTDGQVHRRRHTFITRI